MSADFDEQCQTMLFREDTGNLPCSSVLCPGQHSHMLGSLLAEHVSDKATST